MKNIKSLFAILLAMMIIQSCYEDKGNYDFIDLDEVIIDTTNLDIKASYAIYRFDSLNIDPKIYLNGNLITNKDQVKEKLSFTWNIYQATIGQNVYTVDTLSHELTLNKPIKKEAGNWIILLTIKDLVTKIETYHHFGLNISEFTSGGWMVLYERDGNTDVGLIVDDRVKNGITQSLVLMDLIKLYNGAPIKGKPINLFHSQIPTNNRYIFVTTDNEYVGLSNVNFGIINSFEYNFFSTTIPEVKAPQYAQSNNNKTEVLINNNKVYSQNFITLGTNRSTILYSLPLTGEYGQLASWLPISLPQSLNAIVYDSTNKKFLQSTSRTNKLVPFPNQSTSTQFDVNNVDLDLITSDWGKGSGPIQYYEYLLMKNNTNKYLLIANFHTLNTVGIKKYDITNLPDINNANRIAAGLNGEFIYYASDNKLYRYLYGNNSVVDLVWTAPAGESITCIEIQKTYDFIFMLPNPTIKLPSANKLVHIATWDENNKNGKVYNIIANDLNGNLDLSSQRMYTGFGKIKDMKQKLEL